MNDGQSAETDYLAGLMPRWQIGQRIPPDDKKTVFSRKIITGADKTDSIGGVVRAGSLQINQT
jgi:hypothetical protein